MAATYLILAAGELLHGPDRIAWPRCLHVKRESLSDMQRDMWAVEILDDDAPPGLDGKQVELTLTRTGHDLPEVTGREEVHW